MRIAPWLPDVIWLVATGYFTMDMLAQAEHDVPTRIDMITTDARLAHAVKDQIEKQLTVLATAETAAQAWRACGETAICADKATMIAYSDHIAAEHLQVHTADPKAFAKKAAQLRVIVHR